MPDGSRKPLWLYPNLLSLDAPLVAVVWLHMFARTWRLGYHPWEAYAALALGVWVIYTADRLLDVALARGRPSAALEPRHLFHFRHGRRFKTVFAIASLGALFLFTNRIPVAIYLYLLPCAILTAGYFGLSLLRATDHADAPVLKNIFAGGTFALGVAVMALVYRHEAGLGALLVSREFFCFAVLCILNIGAIDLWEHSARATDQETKASDELSLTLPLALLALASLVFAIQDEPSRPFFYAILTGAALLHLLNRRRHRFSADALRVLADVALLLPYAVFSVASRA
jgi:hypothetical protein